MPSFKARLLTFVLRNRHVLKGQFWKPKPVDWMAYESIIKFREEVEKGAARFGKIPEGIETERVQIGDMPAEWIRPSGATDDATILYFHGGGYVSGTISAHRAIVAKFVDGSKVRALLFEYRLAPEHPFPAALDDAIAAYQWLLDQGIAPGKIAFVGDSGGAGLILATLLKLRDQGAALPTSAAVISPVTDFTCSGKSYVTNARLCLSPEGMGPACGKHYAGGADLTNPYISPLFGDLHGLPPLLIYVGGNETLRDDSTRFASKAKEAGVDTTLHVGEGLFHCYPAVSPLIPEAKEAMDDICRFVRTHAGL